MNELIHVRYSKLTPWPDLNSRRWFDPVAGDLLRDSIREHGVQETLLGAAFVERLAKHLRTKTHRACRVAEPTSETLPAACPSPGTLEDAAGRETLDQEGRA